MVEYGAELFAWLEDGGLFYVCGDATWMAKDVVRDLHEVIATHGTLSTEQAADYALEYILLGASQRVELASKR